MALWCPLVAYHSLFARIPGEWAGLENHKGGITMHRPKTPFIALEDTEMLKSASVPNNSFNCKLYKKCVLLKTKLRPVFS